MALNFTTKYQNTPLIKSECVSPISKKMVTMSDTHWQRWTPVVPLSRNINIQWKMCRDQIQSSNTSQIMYKSLASPLHADFFFLTNFYLWINFAFNFPRNVNQLAHLLCQRNLWMRCGESTILSPSLYLIHIFNIFVYYYYYSPNRKWVWPMAREIKAESNVRIFLWCEKNENPLTNF